MSNYYKYNFVSPEPIYSIIKEEFKSYMDTGAVDSLLFPSYLDKALKKLGRTSYIISEHILYVQNFEARLPDNFYAVREAWMCSESSGGTFQSPSAFYSQAISAETIQISPAISNGEVCDNSQCVEGCPENMPNLIPAVYKTTGAVELILTHEYLLKPGNISTQSNCSLEYNASWSNITSREFTPGSTSYDSFDINNNKFVTNFRNGIVHLLFYATEHDDIGNQLIPDNYRITEYVEAYIKYKLFETLTNQTNDETFNQLQQKLVYYKQLYEEAYIMADIEIKKQTSWEKQRRIKKDLNRNNMYGLANSTNKFRRRIF